MNLDHLSQKQLNELEQHVRDLLAIMRKAKLHNEPIAELLRHLEQNLGQTRRERFDATNTEYHSY